MKILNKTIYLFFVMLVIGNVYIFVSGIKLSDQINHFEAETAKIHQQNIELENKIFEITSLKETASMAASLNFTEKPAPIVLENNPYAFNR